MRTRVESGTVPAVESRGATSQRSRRLRSEKNGILQPQEVQVAADAAVVAAYPGYQVSQLN